MRFLADSRCDFAAVRALRAAGHDVRSVVEERPAEPDESVTAWALAEDRVLIAEDKDFGYLVHAARVSSAGVVLVRFPASQRAAMVRQVIDAVDQLGDRLQGAFTVIEPGRVRISSSGGP